MFRRDVAGEGMMNMVFRTIGICFLVLLTLASPSYAQDAEKTLTVALAWQLEDGLEEHTAFAPMAVSELSGQGVWVRFEQQEGTEQTYPGLFANGAFHTASAPIEKMKSLELVVTLDGYGEPVVRRHVLFSDTRILGTGPANAESITAINKQNVYHLMVLDSFVDAKDLPEKDESAGLWRTRRLAMNYAVQSDAQTQSYEELFAVKASYELPRLIVVAEEWLVLEEKKQESQPGLFSLNILDDEQPVVHLVPTYSVDVLLDEVEAAGQNTVGFQSSRSISNDVLEGEVIYHAGGGQRTVVNAAIVFSQMVNNIENRNSDNELVHLNSKNLARIDNFEGLWDSAKRNISDFLTANPDWEIIIPKKPVVFYGEKQLKEGEAGEVGEIYAMYAWYRVHPQSGRMIGVLPNGMRGAFSDEVARLEEFILAKAESVVEEGGGGGAVKALISQISGMWVSTAGFLHAISLTIADPALDALSMEEWKQFMISHALGFCKQFLIDNAGSYDYATQVGFWQGAMTIACQFGDRQDTQFCLKEVMKNAYEAAKDKAISDAKAYVEKRLKSVGDAAEELSDLAKKDFEDALGKFAPRLKDALATIEKLQDAYEKGQATKEKLNEAIEHFNEVKQDFESEMQRLGVM